MKNFNNYTKIEDFLFDPEFNQLINKGGKDDIHFLFEKYPDKKELINSASILLLHLNVKDIEFYEDYIDKKYKELQNRIKSKKRRFILIRWSAAACLLAMIMSIFFLSQPGERSIENTLFTLMDSTSLNVESIRLSTSDIHVKVDENKEIVQTPTGDILIGNEEKIESSKMEDEYIQLIVPNGKRTSISFSDGTIARVNSGSKLIYPRKFKDNKREIYVDGEIYIAVAKEKDKKFLVRTKNITVAVLGTKFNVSAYNNDNIHSIVLVEGAVEVSTDNYKSKIAPNQAFFQEDGKASIKEVDTYKYICWKDGIIKLDNEPLDAIFKKIARYYNISIQQNNQDFDMSKEIYRGKLDLNDSLQEVLDNLAHSSNFTYKVYGKIVCIE
ncbi:MAG: FecR family protein [Tannerella sp.]|jgi:hypothetical protein|nr:FecR family protein [Tannerella sp.]